MAEKQEVKNPYPDNPSDESPLSENQVQYNTYDWLNSEAYAVYEIKSVGDSPTYHVFFFAAKTEDFKRAFSEYIGKGQGKKRGKFTREQMQQQAQKFRNKPHKQKQRENKGEQTLIYNYFKPAPTPRARSDDIFTADFYAKFSEKELQYYRSAPKS